MNARELREAIIAVRNRIRIALGADPLRPEWSIKDAGNHKEYVGDFMVYDRAWRYTVAVRGCIREWSGLPTDVYLHDPPQSLVKHPHGPCLQLLRPGELWFRLHWSKPAKSFEETRGFVEQMLWEAETRRRIENGTGS